MLWVETQFGKEYYKRFFFRDIQSIVMLRTHTHMVWAFVWGIPAITFGLLALSRVGPNYFFSVCSALFFIALFIDLAIGPSCTVYLQTAVQIQKLTVLKRVRFARKVMAKIKTQIEKVQGPFQVQHTTSGPSASNIASMNPTGANLKTPLPNYASPSSEIPFNPLIHRLLFGALFLSGFIAAIQFAVKSLMLGAMILLMHSCLQVLGVVALVRWYRQIKGSLIAKINWLSLFFITLQSVFGYVLFIIVSIRNPMINYHHWEMFKQLIVIQQTKHPLALAGNLVYIGGCVIFGVYGFILAMRFRSRQKTS